MIIQPVWRRSGLRFGESESNMARRRYDDVELAGEARTEALQRCRRQIAGWNLQMPRGRPLVLDFGLGEFEKTGLIEFWVANEPDAGYCGKFLFVFDGQTCPYHHHNVKHETFFVLKGAVRMKVNGKACRLREGDSLAMLPGTKHSFQGDGPALLLEVSQPSVRGDNFFCDKRVAGTGVI